VGVKVQGRSVLYTEGKIGMPAMRIIVRYWISNPPVGGEEGGRGGWVDHSSHPSSRLGLHNAILAAEDRLAILRSRYQAEPHGCNIFIESGKRTVMLNVREADDLLGMLQDGGMAWETLAALVEVNPSGTAPSGETAAVPDHAREVAEYETDALQGRHRIDCDV
jgi:hypothetical protein